MISANGVTLRVGKKALFEDVNIKFTPGNCYGLIGANGAGKSTFVKILSGVLEPTEGEVIFDKNKRMAVLNQNHFAHEEDKVLDVVLMGHKKLWDIIVEKNAIYAKEEFTDEDGIRAGELEGEFAELNGWEAETEAETLLMGLGIGTDLHHKYMKELGEPEKVKVLLADLPAVPRNPAVWQSQAPELRSDPACRKLPPASGGSPLPRRLPYQRQRHRSP